MFYYIFVINKKYNIFFRFDHEFIARGFLFKKGIMKIKVSKIFRVSLSLFTLQNSYSLGPEKFSIKKDAFPPHSVNIIFVESSKLNIISSILCTEAK